MDRMLPGRRRQRVVTRNGHSSWRNVKRGVPQGSILGAVLFILFTNDLSNSMKATAEMFADDTQLHSKISKHCENL